MTIDIIDLPQCVAQILPVSFRGPFPPKYLYIGSSTPFSSSGQNPFSRNK